MSPPSATTTPVRPARVLHFLLGDLLDERGSPRVGVIILSLETGIATAVIAFGIFFRAFCSSGLTSGRCFWSTSPMQRKTPSTTRFYSVEPLTELKKSKQYLEESNPAFRVLFRCVEECINARVLQGDAFRREHRVVDWHSRCGSHPDNAAELSFRLPPAICPRGGRNSPDGRSEIRDHANIALRAVLSCDVGRILAHHTPYGFGLFSNDCLRQHS
jgi:hypothetical protein